MANTISLHSTIKDVPLAKMRVSMAAQRSLQPSRVDYLASVFDPEQLAYPVISMRDGWAWIVDGQHRLEAAKRFLGDIWETQSISCRVYTGMSEQDEAKMFLRLNNVLTVSAFDKFKRAVTAGYADERGVEKAAEKAGLKIAREKGDGNVSAVTTLLKIYKRSDAKLLTRSLGLVYQSFGDPGLSNNVIDGIARVCERYDGAIKDADATERLQSMRGGVGALTTRAMLLRKQTGVSIPECIAAATVDALNAKRGGKKLPSWWKE